MQPPSDRREGSRKLPRIETSGGQPLRNPNCNSQTMPLASEKTPDRGIPGPAQSHMHNRPQGRLHCQRCAAPLGTQIEMCEGRGTLLL